MKLQGMSIIFALVIVPIILVVSYYIQLQVDTINLQSAYSQKLLDATHDAMATFEINTANEDLSTVSDSLRTIIEASYNVFINNLSTNLGMSNANKSYVEPYIPSVLYTLYDGYYICAPTKVPTVLIDSDGNAISVGDKGVSGSPDNYTYNEASDNLLGKDVGLDYGQLLYLKNGSTNQYTTNIENAKLQTKNVLKTYMPYSARYFSPDKFDLTIIYTLDNFITVEGTIGNVYYTKSGYLIPSSSVEINISNCDIDEASNNVADYNQNDIQDVIENRKADFSVVIKDGSDTTINLNKNDNTKSELNTRLNILNNALKDAQEFFASVQTNVGMDNLISKYTEAYLQGLADRGVNIDTNWFATIQGISPIGTDAYGDRTYSDPDKTTAKNILRDLISAVEEQRRNVQYELDTMSSVVYYAKAYVFSKWVEEYLCSNIEGGCEVKEDDLIEVSGQKYTTIKGVETLEFDFATGANVFNFVGTLPVSVTEIPTDSVFYEHKLKVIKMSIQYNLNLAMSTYNNNESYLFEYEMPVIQPDEWSQILSHISVTTFMQGWKCGLKTYNDYKIVSSTNNDILTLPEEVYYVKKDEFNNEASEYHRINCSKIIDNDTDTTEYMAFSSKEVKYDKIYEKTRDYMLYEYDHKNYACYDCINDGNYFNYDSTGNGKFDTQINIFDSSNADYNNYKNLRKAYYLGVAKERNNTYKMNAIVNSQGYEILLCNDKDGNMGTPKASSLGVDKIKAIELSIGTIYSQNASIRSAIYTFNYGVAVNLSNDSYSIATNNASNNSTQSLKINIIPGKNVGTGKFAIGNLVPVCDNAGEIIRVLATDADGNPTNTGDAEAQFKSAIKYIRVIYK